MCPGYVCGICFVLDNPTKCRVTLPGLITPSHPSEGVLSKACFSNTNQPIQTMLQSPPLSGFHTLSHYPPALMIPVPGTRPQWTASLSQSPRNDSASPALSLLALPHPFLPRETTVETCGHSSPHPSAGWLALVLPQVVPCGVACPLLLGTMSNKISFQW